MSRGLNKAILVGNLGQDPEVRTTGGGSRVAQFSVATTRYWNDQQGQKQEKTEWHRIVVWGKLVDVVEKYLKKGDRVYIEGEIQYRQYDDKEGVTRYVTEINCRDLMMLGGGNDNGSGGGNGGEGRRSGGNGGGRAGGTGGGSYDDFQAPAFEDDDDLPF